MIKNRLFQKSRGFGIIELLVGIAIVSISLGALAGLGNLALKISLQVKKNVIAANLASEVIEAAKAAKEENWSNIGSLTTGALYHPTKTGSPLKWSFADGAETINNFSRQAVISDVYRDANDDIITAGSGGTLDANTKKITTTVSWSDNGQNYQAVLVSYLTNWKP